MLHKVYGAIIKLYFVHKKKLKQAVGYFEWKRHIIFIATQRRILFFRIKKM